MEMRGMLREKRHVDSDMDGSLPLLLSALYLQEVAMIDIENKEITNL
jgi:hypothetical protein